jgi:hypothetical protein
MAVPWRMQRVVGLRIEFEEDATARQGEHMRALLSSMPRKHGTLSSLHIVFSEVGCRDMFDEAVRFHALTYACMLRMRLQQPSAAAMVTCTSRHHPPFLPSSQCPSPPLM